MLSKITLANREGTDIVLHEDTSASRRVVTHATGLLGTPALRESKRSRPQAHGSLNETLFSEGGVVTLEGETWSVAASAAIETAFEEMRKIIQVCQETLDYAPALMKWTEGVSGLKLQKLVKFDSDIDPPEEEAAALFKWHAQFFAEDPRSYSQALTTSVGSGLTGTESEPEWELASASSIAIAVDATHIYMSNINSISRAPIAGGTIETEWIKTSATPRDIVVNGSNVFWCHAGGIGRATIAGGTIENEWLKTATVCQSPATVWSLAIDAAHLYWYQESGSAGAIGRSTVAGGTVEKTLVALGGIEGKGQWPIEVDSEHLYYGQPNALGRMTLTGGSIENTWISGLGFVTGVAVNATNVFWTEEQGENSATVGRAKLTGAEVLTRFVVTGTAAGKSPGRLVLNSEHLYWHSTAGWVGRGLITGNAMGSAVTVKQLGNRPTPVVFVIKGPCKNPSIVGKGTGAAIALTGTLGSGNTIVVNTANRTVLLNGSAPLFSWLNAKSTDWTAFQAPPNPSSETYELAVSSATAATLEAQTRDAYG